MEDIHLKKIDGEWYIPESLHDFLHEGLYRLYKDALLQWGADRAELELLKRGGGMVGISGYAINIVEAVREMLGYSPEDDSHDKEVLAYLQSGEKLSKSKHVKPSD